MILVSELKETKLHFCLILIIFLDRRETVMHDVVIRDTISAPNVVLIEQSEIPIFQESTFSDLTDASNIIFPLEPPQKIINNTMTTQKVFHNALPSYDAAILEMVDKWHSKCSEK